MDSNRGSDYSAKWKERENRMNSVKEIARSIIAAMEDTVHECDPAAARHFRRMAILSYSDAIQHAPVRSREENKRLIDEAYKYVSVAVSFGTDEDSIEDSFAALRAFWVSRLMEVKHAKD